GLCEPSLLTEPEHVTRVLRILDRITKSLAATSARKGEDFKVLKQALGYCWSVAAAAEPDAGRALMEKWLRSTDKDVVWAMQSNLGKARMGAMGQSWVAKWKAKAPVPKPAPASPGDIATPGAKVAGDVLKKPAKKAKTP
ncbi:MAG: hypothetical protein QOI23_2563, partial [Chloroflexota bacterium]|nr:hypothetical protein [Chloroflexota bacterium]